MFLRRYSNRDKKMRYLVLFLTLAFTGGAQAATRTVCASGASYTSINQAVSEASSGDTIQVCAGTYNEVVSVNKANLTIQGASSATVTIKNNDTVFVLGSAATNTRIKNLSIESTSGYGIRTDWESSRTTANVFENLNIKSSNYGVYVANGKTQTFNNVTITSSASGGIFLEYNVEGNHSFTDVSVTSRNNGIEVQRGASQFSDVTVKSSAGLGISISNRIPTTFDTVTVESADQAIYVQNQDGPSTVSMSKVKATSTNGYAINIQKSGVLNFDTVEAASSGNTAIQLGSDAKGNHTLSNIIVSGTGSSGVGIYTHQGLSSLKNATIKSGGNAIDSGNNLSDMKFENVAIDSTNGHGFRFGQVSSGLPKMSFKNITINKAGVDGLLMDGAKTSSVTADNLCISNTGSNGIELQWESRNFSVTNSVFKNNNGAAINANVDTGAPLNVSNSCFVTAPCVVSNSTAHDFNNNYWAPASCQSISNVRAGTKLASCPVQTATCYAGSTGGTSSTAGAFNAYDTATASGALTGSIKTKIAGAGFDVSVIALNTAKTGLQTTFAGDVKLELVASSTVGGSVDAANCPASSTTIAGTTQTVTFASGDAGRKSVTIPALGDVYRDVRVKLTYPATGTATTVACSNDNFAVRPSYLASVAGTDATWTTAGTTRTLGNVGTSGGIVHKAGQPFSVSAVAYTATNSAAASYAGTPTVKTLACSLPQPTCVNGTLTLGAWASAGAGKVTTSTASYTEAGSFNLTLEDSSFAQVDQNDGSTAADITIPQNAAVSVGRFVPDHFSVLAATQPQFRTFNATDASCTAPGKRTFTYVGQNFGWATSPTATVIAQNAAGGTTANYQGSALWKLSAANVTEAYWAKPVAQTSFDTASKGTPAVVSNGNGTGTITSAPAGVFRFLRNATAVDPFAAEITLTVSVTDTSEEATNQSGGILTTNVSEAQFKGSGNGIAFDGAASGTTNGNAFRYGRIKINNAGGSDLLPLTLTVMTQYWDGAKYVLNTDDYCTTTAGSLALAAGTGGAISTSFMTSTGSGSASTPISYQMYKGMGKAVLNKPGNFTAKGSVKVNVSTASALNAYLPGMEGIATFGVYNSSGPIIYIREMY
jgi:hypothetical protein